MKEPNGKKNIAFFDCGSHAREWISHEFCLRLVQRVIDAKNSDAWSVWREIAEVYVLPVVNPDGLVYSRTVNRYWRKNRRKFSLVSSSAGKILLI